MRWTSSWWMLTSMVLTELSPVVTTSVRAPSTASYAVAPASVYACPCRHKESIHSGQFIQHTAARWGTMPDPSSMHNLVYIVQQPSTAAKCEGRPGCAVNWLDPGLRV